MIKINLLPQEMMGGKAAARTPAAGTGGLLIVLVVLLILIINGGFAAYMGFQYASAKREKNQVEQTARELQADLQEKQAEYQEIKDMLDTLNKQVKLLQTLDAPDRMLWARKLNMLPLMVPDGIYLTQVSVETQETEKETPESIRRRRQWIEEGRQGAQPTAIKARIIRQILDMRGVSYVENGTSQDRLRLAIDFISNVRDGEWKVPYDENIRSFMEGFESQPRYFPIETETIGGREVSRFRLALTSKPVTIGG